MEPKDLVEQLLDEALPGLKVNVHFQIGDDEDDVVFPGLVSKEVKPTDRKFGEWRLTLFNEVYRPIGHVTFDHEGPLSAKSVEKAIVDAGEAGTLVNYFNENPFADEGHEERYPYANTVSIEPMS